MPAAVSNLSQLTILAPGLLGGSVAMAARARSVADRIVVWARRTESRAELRKQAWCDVVTDTPEDAVREAEIVVIAAPVNRIVSLAEQVAPALKPGAIITDVGSVKGEIARLGAAAVKGIGHFIGAHPMAGSEKTGWEHGTPILFENRSCFVTPLADSDATAVKKVVTFWESLGSKVTCTGADEHDEIVAHISHLPQVIASSLCAFLSTRNLEWRRHSGGGLRDTTRIAGSDPQLWRTIFELNRDEVLRAVQAYQDELHAFQSALANRDFDDLVARLERGRTYRERFEPR